jgi:hypothetical protein
MLSKRNSIRRDGPIDLIQRTQESKGMEIEVKILEMEILELESFVNSLLLELGRNSLTEMDRIERKMKIQEDF